MIACDTNLLIYAEDPADQSGRHHVAARLLAKLALAGAIVPVQVLGEFVNVCRKKKIAPLELAARKVANYSQSFETPQTEPSDIIAAALLSDRYNLQFFDALIVSVAARSGANLLFSEDMHDGLEVEGLRIINPFLPANGAIIREYLAAG